MLKRNLNLINELCPKKFLLLTDFLDLHGGKVGYAVKGLTIDAL